GSAGLRGRRVERLGALMLSERPFAVPPGAEAARVLARGIVSQGLDRLPWTQPLRQWRDRVAFLRGAEGDATDSKTCDREIWPDLSDEALAAHADEWLPPLLEGSTALSMVTPEAFTTTLHAMLPWPLKRRLDAE